MRACFGVRASLPSTSISEHSASVTSWMRGSRHVHTPYQVKLEGAARVGHRTISIAGTRDPIMISTIDAIIDAAMDAGDAIDAAFYAPTKQLTVGYWQKVFGSSFQG